MSSCNSIGMDCFVYLQNQVGCQKEDVQPTEETKMNTTKLPEEKIYLLDRVTQVYYEVHTPTLRRKFNLDPDPRPTTFKEMRERLEAGQFSLPSDDDYSCHRSGYIDLAYLRWQDPTKKEDLAGYDNARKSLKDLLTKARDAIVVKSVDEGLKVLQDFEALSFD